ncbi:shootin-1 [Aplochiton taeniatus]
MWEVTGLESDFSSEDEEDIQVEILEQQRDEANQTLSDLEQVSSQLLKEIDVLELQFQIERSCRQSAETLAVKVTRENKVLKRRSQMLMPLISELPENMAAMDLECELGEDLVGTAEDNSEELLLQGQAQISELQVSVDRLLADKIQLVEQVETLKREKTQLKEQLTLEIEEKEVRLKKMNKQTKNINKIKRVSQLVTEEFTAMSQKLDLEQGLRQHAEVFAHQMLVNQKESQRQSMVLMQSSDISQQLHQALEQVGQINSALKDVQLYFQSQVRKTQSAMEECIALSELQSLRMQLGKSEDHGRALETQLLEANNTVTQLKNEKAENSILALPPPLDVVRMRRKGSASGKDPNDSVPSVDIKARAVDEMMERIRRGIVLRPANKPQTVPIEDDSWRDSRIEKRKSAVMELKGMLETIKLQDHRRAASRKRMSRNVGEAELLMVLQRRRRAIGDPSNQQTPPKIQDPHPGILASGTHPWAETSGSTPVLRRLQKNREKRDSRIRTSSLIMDQVQEN